MQMKVAWIHFERSAILTVHTHVITRNPRVTVSHENHKIWWFICFIFTLIGAKFEDAIWSIQGICTCRTCRKQTEAATCVRSTRHRPKRSPRTSTSSVICKWAHYEFFKKSIKFFWNFLNSNFQVPPTIDDAMSNSDVIVREGSDLSFTCHARGSPTPTVKWRREDGRKISFNKSYSGEFI